MNTSIATLPVLNLEPSITDKWGKLLERLSGMKSALVAFSGGVDSGLLSVAAYHALNNHMLAITIKTPVEISGSMDIAQKLAGQFGFPHRVLEYNDLDNADFIANRPDRCYVCKQMDFKLLWDIAHQEGFDYLIEGSNADDVSDYRPGRKAAEEWKVTSPLQEVGLKKPEIRAIAKALGLANWDRPSSPCLASRFPYGTKVTRDGLEKVAAGEAYLQQLGFRIVRVRYGGALARLEVDPHDIERLVSIREKVVPYFKQLGFKYVLVDLEGYRQGALNEVLEKKEVTR
jgi:uncharacterized protein